jgi:hypothetical protein
MVDIIDDFDSPSRRVSGDKQRSFLNLILHGAKLIRFPWFNLWLV